MIRAPFAGQVKERSVTQGQYLKVQTPVMVIVNVDPMRVRLRVPEKMAAWVKTGQEVTVSVEASVPRPLRSPERLRESILRSISRPRI
jgi:multidrug resistance efflux pump